MHFFYDAQSRPAMVKFNGAVYSYIHNLQGDIVGFVDSAGSLVVEYKYDAWGKPTLVRTLTTAYEALAELNPFRYRGYVYDEETGLYYLRSRYYASRQNRFINADTSAGFQGVSLEHNVFVYCKNVPVSRYDANGMLSAVADFIQRTFKKVKSRLDNAVEQINNIVYKVKYAFTSLMASVQIEVNSREASKHRIENTDVLKERLIKLGWLISMVNHDAPWDYKTADNKPWWALTDEFYFMGREIGLHEYGNINYGAVAIEVVGEMEFGELNAADIVFMGGGYANLHDEVTLPSLVQFVCSEATPPLYGDKVDDHMFVKLGIEYVRKSKGALK